MEHFLRISEKNGKARIRVIFKNLEKLLKFGKAFN